MSKKMWSEQNTEERIETALRSVKNQIKHSFPDGVPMNLREKDIHEYYLHQILEAQLTVLDALKR